MRTLTLALALYAAAGTAAAGEHDDARASFDSGPRLRVLQLAFNADGIHSLKLAGVGLFERRHVLTQTSDNDAQVIDTIPMEPDLEPTTPPPADERSYFGKMTGVQWLGIGLAVLAVGVIAAGGTGGGGGGDPVVNQTGGS